MDFKLALVGFAVPVILVYWFNKRSLKSPEIPGPPAHPFVGHTFKVPTTKTWKYHESLSHEHGPIMKLTLAGDDILVLSHPSDAQELLGRRSRIYSSRRPLIYAGKYQSNHMHFTLLLYGESFRRQLGAFHQMLEPRAVGGYETLQLSMSLRLLKDMAKAPTEFFRHIPRFHASLVFALSFGRELEEHDLAEVQKILADFVFDINPGAHLVNTFPMQAYVAL